MEKITIKFNQLTDVLKAYEEVVERYDNPIHPLDRLGEEMARESLIQRFEYSTDLLWKYLKQLLADKKDIEKTSPRDVIDESFKQKLVTENEATQLLQVIKDRNRSSHIYDQAISQEIAERALKYFHLYFDILNRNKP